MLVWHAKNVSQNRLAVTKMAHFLTNPQWFCVYFIISRLIWSEKSDTKTNGNQWKRKLQFRTNHHSCSGGKSSNSWIKKNKNHKRKKVSNLSDATQNVKYSFFFCLRKHCKQIDAFNLCFIVRIERNSLTKQVTRQECNMDRSTLSFGGPLTIVFAFPEKLFEWPFFFSG